MKLLVDENLAPRLVGELADLFPGSVHVGSAGLSSAPNIDMWEYANANGFALIKKDSDFASLSLAGAGKHRACDPAERHSTLGL